MSKRSALVVLLVASIAAAAPQRVDEIVAANVAARGGADAWRAVKTLRMSGRMDVGQGVQVPFTLELKRPRRMRLEFLFDGQMVVQVYDGKTGWKKRPFLGRDGYELYTSDELRAAAGQAELDGPLVDYKTKGHRIELLGTEDVEGRRAYKLEVTLATGAVRHLYLDAETFLEVKVDGERRLKGKQTPLATFFRDYKPVNGLLIAHKVETVIAAAPAGNGMVIDRVEVNPPLDDARFAPPASAGTTPKEQKKDKV